MLPTSTSDRSYVAQSTFASNKTMEICLGIQQQDLSPRMTSQKSAKTANTSKIHFSPAYSTTNGVNFTEVVDDFGIKYQQIEDINHLIATINM